MQVNAEVKEKLKTAGQTIWEDETVREKFIDEAGRFSLKKALDTVKDYVSTIRSMAIDIKSGTYIVADKWKWYIALAATAYAISPLDFIPDLIPGVGWSDDAGMIAAAVYFVGDVINQYRIWKFSGTDKAEPFKAEDFSDDVVIDGDFKEVKEESTTNNSGLDSALDKLSNLG